MVHARLAASPDRLLWEVIPPEMVYNELTPVCSSAALIVFTMFVCWSYTIWRKNIMGNHELKKIRQVFEVYVFFHWIAPGRQRSLFSLPLYFSLSRLVSYRYALICQQCFSHNGMALKEEFEYLGKLRNALLHFWRCFSGKTEVIGRLEM